MKFATPYTLPEEREDAFATENNEESMTQQSDAADTDINVIMARYNLTGQMPQVLTEPLTGDFSHGMDYRTMVEKIREAEEAFLEIPAKIRAQFGNDPGEFIKFASNAENRDELEKMGLLSPPKTKTMDEELLDAVKALKPTENGNGTAN